MNKHKAEILLSLEALKHQTDELLANQLHHNEMADNNADGVVIVDAAGIIRFANKTAALMFHCKKPKKLEGEVFAFNPAENKTLEIEIAHAGKTSLAEMRSTAIIWEGKPAMLVILRSSTARKNCGGSPQEAGDKLKSIICSSPLAIIAVDAAGNVTLWSKAAQALFGWDESEIHGHPFPLKGALLEELFKQGMSGESIFKREVSGQFGLHGINKTLNVWATPLSNAGTAASGLMLMIADVTESRQQQRRMERTLLDNEKRFRMALSNSPVSVSTQNLDLRYTWIYNPLGGMQEIHMLGKTDAELFLPEDAVQLNELKLGVLRSGKEKRSEVKLQHDGRVHFYDIYAEPIADDSGNTIGVTCAATDISALRRTESLASYALHHDTLTGLPNRALFRDRLQQALILAQRDGLQRFAVMHFGVDQFKTINQCFGHALGDQLLLDIGKRISTVVYDIDTVCRVGGDEFLILLHNIQESQDTVPVVKKILESMLIPFSLNGQDIYLTASIGIALHPSDGDGADDLLRNADAAMHRAKEDLGGGNYRFFCENMNSQALRKLTLEHDLHRALEQGEFHLHYQPQVDIRSNLIIGAEALIRWQHPHNGNIPPGEFIPASESSGLIEAIGDWVLLSACRQHRAWIEAGLPPIRIAVNLSARQFLRGDLLDKVAAALAASDMQAEFLELELTESMLMHDVDNTVKTLRELKTMGVRLSIDDFGTGYSSLSYLKRFPLDTLKIDRSFVTDLGTESDDGEIARVIIAMAHALDLEVVAEGVENQQQLDFMRESKCDFVQGYFFSRPVAAEECERLLLKNRAQGLFALPRLSQAA